MQKNQYGKVAVLMGGDTTEREISFISGNAVLESLLKSGVDAFAFDPAVEPLENLKKYGCTRAFIMIHGKNGEDGKLQGALEYLGIPYTGAGVMSSAIGMDKYRTKLIWQSMGIPLAKSLYLEKVKFKPNDLKLSLKYPLIIKPAGDGSSLGLKKVFESEQLLSAIESVFAVADSILIEELIIGDEYTITIINGKVYPIIKIESPTGEYDYEHKYFSDETVYLCPYNLGELQSRVEEWALIGYNSIGASGAARLDFMIDKKQNVYFLEINTIPGMTPHSLVPQSVASVGINFDKLCLIILDGAGLGK